MRVIGKSYSQNMKNFTLKMYFRANNEGSRVCFCDIFKHVNAECKGMFTNSIKKEPRGRILPFDIFPPAGTGRLKGKIRPLNPSLLAPCPFLSVDIALGGLAEEIATFLQGLELSRPRFDAQAFCQHSPSSFPVGFISLQHVVDRYR